jgi:glutamate synthase (NADPH/NADH) large chain
MDYAARHVTETARLQAAGIDLAEHDACGVGFVAAIDGQPRRQVVDYALAALKALWHRGAVDADGKTGDGAGIHLQVSQPFFHDHVRVTGQAASGDIVAVGQVFLPRTDLEAQEVARTIVESETLAAGYLVYGWRQVPVDLSVLGEKAVQTRPEIVQIMISNRGTAIEKFETDLYLLRRRIENRAAKAGLADFYICSLSARSIVYKGMVLAAELAGLYPDLLDPRFVSNFAIYHQRYSTNTFPKWKLAHPYRVLAHNGEINTLKGNVNWMAAHEPRMASSLFGDRIDDVRPVIQPGGSDSAVLDNVFEAMIRAGRSAPMVKSLLIPEAVPADTTMPEAHQAFYRYCNAVMEPWDGPAALAMYDGRYVCGGMDRNGLRPMRTTLTHDGMLIVGSESGMVALDEADILEKGRVGPGQMIAVDLAEGRLYYDRELKDMLAATRPYGEWTRNIVDLASLPDGPPVPSMERDALKRYQMAAGITQEDLELILQPMAEEGKEAVGSMGDDTPLAVLSGQYRGLHHFFRQAFSQVTNPPIDSLRERRGMTLRTRLGNLGNILDEDASQCDVLQLESPILSNARFAAMRAHMGNSAVEIDCTFHVAGPKTSLREALDRIRAECEAAVRGGATHLILTDEGMDADRAAVPMILATSAAHFHLIAKSLRTYTSLNVRSGQCLDVHHFAVLVGVGATTVNAWLAEASIADRHRRGLLGGKDLDSCLASFQKAVDDGLLKIMSKMGISVISSYRGGCCFEAIGLSRSLAAEYLPGCTSRISGIGLYGIQKRIAAQHRLAFDEGVTALPVGGFYRYRDNAERHGWEAAQIHLLQSAVASGDYRLYRKYAEAVNERLPTVLRDLLDFANDTTPVPLEQVEGVEALRTRFVTPGMSLGALGPEAHGTLNVAMNRIGARSVSGEGGEDPARYTPDADGNNRNSAVKQIASGRFGVTAEYLNQCREIEIKIAQGAKPGEGGQLPGFKVTELIARLRHATPGVTLISPPPHHDIYSIEDLAQLIYDLKQINPKALVCVKLVARSGIGAIAAGVAKANADVILVAGHSGGTGASPQTSIKHAGIPWEMGLSEAHQVLTLNRLRHRVRLRTDGGLKTGRDIVVAALLGAEEFGIGTASLVAMGCIMVRQCHSNTCPVGVCTQDEALRQKFTGTPEKVVSLFDFIAEDVREILAQLGFSTLDEIVGRADLLRQVDHGAGDLDDLDLSPLLVRADPGTHPMHCTMTSRNEVPDGLDAQIIRDAQPLFEHGEAMQLSYLVRNTDRAVGTRLSGHIVRQFGMTGLEPDHITIRLTGTAGQSLGAFAVQGVRLEVMGDANDYVGKGLSGGIIVLRPPSDTARDPARNVIVGNTVLYGATSGRLFACGQAGERFAVRNSGADAVVEGCGSNGCEYMTGGIAVILGPTGENFAAGMTGGMAYVWDEAGEFPQRLNPDSVFCQRVGVPYYENQLRGLIEAHAEATASPLAHRLLRDWPAAREQFWQIVPREIAARLDVPVMPEAAELPRSSRRNPCLGGRSRGAPSIPQTPAGTRRPKPSRSKR